MDDLEPTPKDILEAWREAARAADLAERLAILAVAVHDDVQIDATTRAQIADAARSVGQSADRVATIARQQASETPESD